MKFLFAFVLLFSSTSSFAAFEQLNCVSPVTGADFSVQYDRWTSQTRYLVGWNLQQALRAQGTSEVLSTGLASMSGDSQNFAFSTKHYSNTHLLEARSESGGIKISYRFRDEATSTYFFQWGECRFN